MKLRPQMRELGIVVVGDFNPAILHPSWLASVDLIRPAEASDASIDVVHKELASFELPWMKLTATTGTLQLSTAQEPYFVLLRDLACGILALLEHTPVRALGINWTHYYSLPDKNSYLSFLDNLAPKMLWKPALSKPSTLRVTVREPQPKDYEGYIDVTVARNDKFQHCIHTFINDHNQIDGSSKSKSAEQVRELLQSEKWAEAEERPFHLADSLFADIAA